MVRTENNDRIELSTYWGDNEFSHRKAHVMKNSHGYDFWLHSYDYLELGCDS